MFLLFLSTKKQGQSKLLGKALIIIVDKFFLLKDGINKELLIPFIQDSMKMKEIQQQFLSRMAWPC